MGIYKHFFKKTIAMVSAVAMLSTVTDWSQVLASARQEKILVTQNIACAENTEIADNDELFAGYVKKAFLGRTGISIFSSENHAKSLNQDELGIYNKLKTAATDIAAGTRSSTEITFDDWTMTFTYEELGLNASSDSDTIRSAVRTAFSNKIDIGKILDCLLADCPYELYWYHKTNGTGSGYSIACDGKKCTLSGLCFQMSVVSAYASGTYTTNTAKTGATKLAVENAKAIVEENKDKSDYEKLVAYRDKICELVSYNTSAASSSSSGYGDPWQLIYVFDNDSSTNVVCEGYSKAFQYLCELSTFDDDVICYTVSGSTTGNHMWNHVTIGGKNYLVDVTNCDAGTIGAPDKLFLKGMAGNISSGYSKTIGSYSIKYTFDNESKEIFGTGDDSALLLSAEDYKEGTVRGVSVVSSVSSLIWHYNEGATLTATPKLAADESGTPEYQWYKVSDGEETAITGATNSTYTMETGLSAGTYTYRVYASIGECKKSAKVSVQVEPLKLTASDLEFTSDTITKEYDGTTTSTATVQIKAGVVDTNAVLVDGMAVYDSANVKEATKVIFTPTAITSGNYTLAMTEMIEHTAAITKKKGIAAPVSPTASTEDIKDTEITLIEVTGCEYSKDGTVWQDSPKFTGLTPNMSYTFYQRIKAGDNTEASAISEATIKTLRASLNNAEITLSLPQGGYTYDGTEKKPSVTVTLNGSVVDASHYTVAYTDNKNAGTEAKVTVTAKTDGIYSGSASAKFTIKKLIITPSIEGTTSKSYDGSTTCDGTGLSIRFADVISGEDVVATAIYTYDSATVGTNKTITANITLSGEAAKNYELSSKTVQADVGNIVNDTESPTSTPTEEPEEDKTPNSTKAPVTTKVPKVGTKLKDAKNVYIVTKVTKATKTVEYRQPQSKNITSANVPNTVKIKGISYKVTVISTNAFKDCKKLTKVTIGSNILRIGKNAFKNCKKLKSITFKSSKLKLKNVGKDAFKGLNGKVVITVPAKQYKLYKKILLKRGVGKSAKIKKKK